jgi:ParB/RepB/Spo0J family partition protein
VGRVRLSETVAAAAELLAEGDRAHAGIPEDARDLLVGEIEADALQPRRHFDPVEMQALADDIARRGVLQPILVRPPAEPGGPYRLVAGERRWRAAKMAGKARIPARVRDLSDEDVRAAQLAENVLRAGLTDIEKGKALRRLYEIRKAQNYKTTWEDIAAEVGLGRARIHDLFNLASLPEPIARLIETGRLSGSHGIALQRAQGGLYEDQLIALAEKAARPEAKRQGGYGMSVAALRHALQYLAGQQTVSPYTLPALTAGAAAANTTGVPAEVRPFVRRTLEALGSGTLTPEEQRRLREMLESTRNQGTATAQEREGAEAARGAEGVTASS